MLVAEVSQHPRTLMQLTMIYTVWLRVNVLTCAFEIAISPFENHKNEVKRLQ